MIKQLFCDMDGIFVDFDAGVRRWFNVDWHPTVWSIPYREVFHMSEMEFWYRLDNYSFWSTLPWTSDGKRIVELISAFEPCILSHGRVPMAYAGKIEWLHREIPDVVHMGRMLLSGKDKSYVARPGAVLIDDNGRNCEDWMKAGGQAILYPRPWNANKDVPYPLNYLMSMLLEVNKHD